MSKKRAPKAKTVTEADRLKCPCPTCHVKAGERCIDPLREVTPRCHKTRGEGQYERHLQERIDRTTARQKASYGPLFQDIAEAEVKVPTVAEVKAEARFDKARAFDANMPHGMFLCDQANKGMEWLAARHIGNELERAAGEVGRLIADHAFETYPLSYQRMILKELMTTTKTREVGPYRVPTDTKLGFRIEYRHKWAPEQPLMTAEEFNARFPAPDHHKGLTDAPEPDDGGLFERTIGAITRSAS